MCVRCWTVFGIAHLAVIENQIKTPRLASRVVKPPEEQGAHYVVMQFPVVLSLVLRGLNRPARQLAFAI
jgi:hypothetical protein